MARWRVQYQGADKKLQTTFINLPEEYTAAMAVQNAIEKGEVPDLLIAPGAIVLVQKSQATSGTVRVVRG